MSACDRCLARAELTVALAAVAPVPSDAPGATPATLIEAVPELTDERIRSVRQHWRGWSAGSVRQLGEANGLIARCGCDERYPAALRELSDAPPVVWIRGAEEVLAALPDGALGIVGTRRPTRTGRDAARRIAAGVARGEGLIISGMALGVDAAAHEGALSVGRPTVAVLASGADLATPASNAGLYARILERGAVLSEMPPGQRPMRWGFPARNRLIAALSAATLVVEAPARSGALITVRHAADLGREVLAVPGSLAAESCAGSNRLLVDGAGAVLEAADALAQLGLAASATPATPAGGAPAIVHAALALRPLSLGEVERTVRELGPGEVELALLDLELAGWILRRPDGRYALAGASG